MKLLGRGSLIPFVKQSIVIVVVTALLLEIVTRLVWGQQQTITFGNKQISLLPLPLVTQTQLEILDEWGTNANNYVQFDSVLGWSIKPSVTAEWGGKVYTSNSIGIRSLREYDPVASAGVIRLASFGPSFTHGDEVGATETWQAQMERARPNLEVMNWGVGGYGTDQAFLRYKTQGVAFNPHIVIIGFEQENVFRNVNRFRSFYRPGTGLPLTKPVYITDTHNLTLLDNPFKTFDDFYDTLTTNPRLFLDKVCPGDMFCNQDLYQTQPLDIFAGYRLLRTLRFEMTRNQNDNLDQESYQQGRQATITLQIIQAFIEEIVRNGSQPLVVVFPEQSTISDYEHGRLPVYHTGIIALRDQGVPVIDLAAAFVDEKRKQNLQYQDFYASEGGHFNKLGNRVVAETILWNLCSQQILSDC